MTETRALVSEHLDGGGAELARRRVEAHIRRCPACAAFRQDVLDFTELLRGVPLETPSRRFGGFETPRKVVRRARARALTSSAAVILGVAFVGSLAYQVAPIQDSAGLVVIGASLVEPAVGIESIRALAREDLANRKNVPEPLPASKPALPAVN